MYGEKNEGPNYIVNNLLNVGSENLCCYFVFLGRLLEST